MECAWNRPDLRQFCNDTALGGTLGMFLSTLSTNIALACHCYDEQRGVLPETLRDAYVDGSLLVTSALRQRSIYANQPVKQMAFS